MSKFEMYEDKAGEFRWRFISSNGRVIATSSEGYKAKTDCQHGIDLVKTDGPKAEVHEEKE